MKNPCSKAMFHEHLLPALCFPDRGSLQASHNTEEKAPPPQALIENLNALDVGVLSLTFPK